MTLKKRFYPWAAALPKEACIKLSTLFGLGNLKMPGTCGSAVGVLLYVFVFADMGLFAYLLIAALLSYIAVGICDTAERGMGIRDPHKVILDEFVAMPICFLPIFGHSFSFVGVLVGFVLFRYLDISKPLFINKMQDFEGGMGIVLDDIVAALVACVFVNIAGLLISGIFA